MKWTNWWRVMLFYLKTSVNKYQLSEADRFNCRCSKCNYNELKGNGRNKSHSDNQFPQMCRCASLQRYSISISMLLLLVCCIFFYNPSFIFQETAASRRPTTSWYWGKSSRARAAAGVKYYSAYLSFVVWCHLGRRWNQTKNLKISLPNKNFIMDCIFITFKMIEFTFC